MSEALKLFRDSMTLLFTNAPLHASVASQLKPKVMQELDAPGATDGSRLILFNEEHLFKGKDGLPPFIDPDASMVERLSTMAALVAHETEHVLRLATVRGEALIDTPLAKEVLPKRRMREKIVRLLFNIAQDFVINRSVLSMGFTLPGDPMLLEEVKAQLRQLANADDDNQQAAIYLHDPALEGRSEEDIVNELLQVLNDNPETVEHLDKLEQLLQQLGLDDHDEIDDSPQAAQQRQQVVQRAAQAARMMKGRGKVPTDFESLLDHGVPDRPIPWRKLLARAVQEVIAGQPDWTTQRPNRWLQTVGSPVLGFGETALGVKRLGFAIDTSASMGMDELAAAIGALRNLLRAAPPEEVVVVHCDAEVQHEETIRFGAFRADRLRRVHGGGGTAFAPALEQLAKRDVDMMVYVTDGYGDEPSTPPVPVIWLTTTGYLSAGFGTKIKLEV